MATVSFSWADEGIAAPNRKPTTMKVVVHEKRIFIDFLCVSFLRILSGPTHDRRNDFLITGTATEVPIDAAPYVRFSYIGILHEQRLRSQNHSRRAIPALKAIVFDKRLLQRIELAILRQAFNRRDLSLCSKDRKDGAGMGHATIDQDSTGAAITRLTTSTRSC